MSYYRQIGKCILSFIVILLFTNNVFCQNKTPEDAVELKQKSRGDFTILLPHISLENNFTDKANEVWTNTSSIDGYYVVTHKRRMKLGLSMKIPFVYNYPGQDTTKIKVGGMGDINLGVSYSLKFSSSPHVYRFLAALGTTLNTATSGQLGKRSWVLTPRVSISRRFNQHFNIIVGTGYGRSLYTNSDGKEVNNINFAGSFVASTGKGWFASIAYKGGFNFSKSDDFISDIGIETGNLFTKTRSTSFQVGYKLPINNANAKYSAYFGVKHYL